jgi:hypothetical protein
LLVEGGGDPFLSPPGGHTVRINFQQPVQAITVATGGAAGGLTPEQAALLARIGANTGLIPALI